MYEFTMRHAGIDDLERIINTHEQMKNHYFWNPPNIAALRRKFERMNTHPEIAWTENGTHYTAETKCTCSCNHIYYNGIFTRNGKKTNISAIRSSYQRMLEEMISYYEKEINDDK